MLLRRIILVSFMIHAFVVNAQAASVQDYLPSGHLYNKAIALPKDILGFGIGEHQVRHDQLLTYVQTIAQQSERVLLTDIGKTKQLRKQVLLTISSRENLANLDNYLNERAHHEVKNSDEPLVIWLGYSVHGDEISGANAAMLVAYHLAASEHPDVKAMLAKTIIVIEPSMNPDGMDRFVNWAVNHQGSTLNSDPNHIEHHQGWRTGRTNHFGFDLNRDWLLLTQQETQNRLAYFHRYKPHVLGDFHEMGANGSYFFQPGIPTRTHPFTPEKSTELTQLMATYHAATFNQENRLYYSEESFDDFYYGKGSTYPDINGGIGILFEQAGSRGMQQDTSNGLLTFEFGIKNHVLTSLSTIEGAWKNSDKFKNYRRDFYQESLKLAKNEKFNGYLISEAEDHYRLEAFLNILKQHQINAFPLTEDFRFEGKAFDKNTSYYIPLAQAQYRVIKALFEQPTNFQDNTFYDVSGWTMPLAMNLTFHRVSRTWGLKFTSTPWHKRAAIELAIDDNTYAYVFDWHHFLSPKLLNHLLKNNIKVKVTTQPFTAIVAGIKREFSQGAIVIPAGIQVNENWRHLVVQASRNNEIDLAGLMTGLTIEGIDIGSESLMLVKPIKVLLLGGKGVSQSEAGEVLYYLDETLNIPVTVVEQQRLPNINLNAYTHIVMVDGSYEQTTADEVSQIEAWLKQGGVVFAQKRAAKWLSDRGILKANFVTKDHLDQLFDTDNLSYKDKDNLAARKRIAGAIFETRLDVSHPLAYGYSDNYLPLFRNSTLIMDFPSQPFLTVAKYATAPLLSGYADINLVNRLASNAAIVGHNFGKGRVIATSDNLLFRGYWLGSAKILANSLFFAKAFDAPIKE